MIDRDKFKQKMSECLRVPVARLEDSAVMTNLVSDSFILVDMVIELQEEFDVQIMQEHLKQVVTVSDLIRTFDDQFAAKHR